MKIVDTLVNQVMARAASLNNSEAGTRKRTIRRPKAKSPISETPIKIAESPYAKRDSMISKKSTPALQTLSPLQKSLEKDASVFKNTNIVSKLSEKEIRIQVVSDEDKSEETQSPRIKPLLQSRATTTKSKSVKVLTPSVPEIVVPKVETKNNFT